MKPPICDGAMVIGPRRSRAYSSAMPALPARLLARDVQRRQAGDLEDHPQLQVILQVLADAGQRVCNAAMPWLASRDGSPMPDSCSRCGEFTAPAARITSRPARTVLIAPSMAQLDAGNAAALDDKPQRLGAGPQRQVRRARAPASGSRAPPTSAGRGAG